jgi:hypothetical protein
MPASWYDDQGPAADVLHVSELPDPVPGPGEVRVRVTVANTHSRMPGLSPIQMIPTYSLFSCSSAAAIPPSVTCWA